MIQYQTLTEMLDHRARGTGAIGYLEGEGAEKTLPLAKLRHRALGILHQLQRIGAVPGDMLILHVASNEQFIDAYWACLYGGIVPVPITVGISDEHKQKLLRIARQLGNPFLYTDRKLRERLAAFAATQGEPEAWTRLVPRTFLVDQLDDISREATPARLTSDQAPATPRAIRFARATSSAVRLPRSSHAQVYRGFASTTCATPPPRCSSPRACIRRSCRSGSDTRRSA